MTWPWLVLASGGLTAAVAVHAGHGVWQAGTAGAAAVVTASAVLMVGERLWHSGSAGVLAATLWVLAPAALAGSAAPTLALATALAVAGIALFLAPHSWTRWVAGALLAGACILEPTIVFVGLALGPMAILRGNIYATPAHVGVALLQALIVPALGAVAHFVAKVPSVACQVSPPMAATLATTPSAAGLVLMQNPVVHFAGFLAVAALLAGALVATARRFRLSRAPGRVQFRLETPLAQQHGRALWLAVLIAASPPMLWPPLLAVGAAAGVRELGRDAPGFGVALAIGLLAFAGLVFARGWGLVWGGDPAVAVQLIPWTTVAGC